MSEYLSPAASEVGDISNSSIPSVVGSMFS